MTKLAYYGPHDYNEEQVLNWLRTARPEILTIDTETVSLKDRRMIGLGMALSSTEAVYFPTMSETSPYLDLAWRLLAQDSLKLFFNALYDLYAIAEYKITGSPTGPTNIGDHKKPLVRDAGTAGQIQGLPRNSLQEQTGKYIGWEIDSISDILPKGKNMLDLATHTVAWKCIVDCLGTRHLWDVMGGERWWSADGHTWKYNRNPTAFYDLTEPTSYYVTQAMKDCFRVDMRLIPLLMRMSHKGMLLRPDRLERWHEKLSQELLIYSDICEAEGFNPNSPQQVGYVLADRGSFLPFTKSGKQLATGEDVLSELSDPLARVVLEYRSRSKLLGTYIKPWMQRLEEGHTRAFTHFRMDLSTARLASYDDNQQNIPGKIHEVFQPDDGVWSAADASQIEYRVFAYECQDPVMLQAYKDDSDIHAFTQAALWPDTDLDDKEARRKPKIFNFAMVYGYNKAVAKTLAKNTGLSVAACQEAIDLWENQYPVATAHLKAHADGPLDYVETLYGRRCKLPRVGEMGYTLQHIINCKHSWGPQAGAQEIIKRAMLMCADFDQRLQVHDEILCNGEVEFPLDDMARICSEVHTPFNVSIGPDWS